LQEGWWDTGPCYPEKWWMPHPWKCSNSGWMELWAIWSSGRCLYPQQGGWTRWYL